MRSSTSPAPGPASASIMCSILPATTDSGHACGRFAGHPSLHGFRDGTSSLLNQRRRPSSTIPGAFPRPAREPGQEQQRACPPLVARHPSCKSGDPRFGWLFSHVLAGCFVVLFSRSQTPTVAGSGEVRRTGKKTAVTARTPTTLPGTFPRRPSPGSRSTCGRSPRCPRPAPPTCSSEELAAAAGRQQRQAAQGPLLPRLLRHPRRRATTSTTCATRSPARSALTQDWPVVIVGIGNLGHALANYSGFRTPRLPRRRAARRRRRAATARSSPALDVRPFDDLEPIVARARRRHRRHRHPGRRRPGRRRPDGRRRHHQHPQLRADRARRCPTASTCARSTSPSSCRSSPTTSSARPDGRARRRRGDGMSVLVVGHLPPSAPVAAARAARRSTPTAPPS